MRFVVLALLLSGCASIPSVAVTVVSAQQGISPFRRQADLEAGLSQAFQGRERLQEFEADWICRVEIPDDATDGWLEADIDVSERTTGRAVTHLASRVPFDPDMPWAAIETLRDRLADAMGKHEPLGPLLVFNCSRYHSGSVRSPGRSRASAGDSWRGGGTHGDRR
jgi:hypothetical protein